MQRFLVVSCKMARCLASSFATPAYLVEECALKIVEKEGLDLFVELASIVDVDVQHICEDVLTTIVHRNIGTSATRLSDFASSLQNTLLRLPYYHLRPTKNSMTHTNLPFNYVKHFSRSSNPFYEILRTKRLHFSRSPSRRDRSKHQKQC